VEILPSNFRKKLFRENFSEILCKPRLTSTKTCEISPYFRQFFFSFHIALKRFTQVLPYVVCTQVRRHVHKRITKRRYGEENPGRFIFGKQVLFTLGLGLTAPYSLSVLVWNSYRTFVIASVEFWLRFEAQIRPTRLAINFWSITARARAGRKVRLWVKLFDFFRGRILIRLTWNLSRSVPHSVEILTWNFRKKLFRENFLEILCKPRLSSTKTCEISPYLLQFLFWVRIALKKFTQVLPYVVCTQVRRHVHKRITKRRYEEENLGRFFFGKQVLFTLGLGLTTPYSLGVFVRNSYQTFVTASVKFWLRFEAQIRPTRLAINFLSITARDRAGRKVRLCVKLFDIFRGRILIRLTWNLSRSVPNSVEILTWNFWKKLFFENFLEIWCKPRLSATETCEISLYFRQFLFWVRIALKKFTQVLPYVVCTQVRRHVHKRITKRRYGEENTGRFVFGKPNLFTLSLGLTAPYSLGLVVWNSYHTFVTASVGFWLRFEAQIPPTRLAIIFLSITARARAGRKVRLCVKLFDFFSWANTHPFDLKFVAFCPKFSGDSYVEF